MKLTTRFTNSIHRLPGRPTSVLMPLLIICAAFLHTAHAINPPPDGGYPGGNTAEGQSALQSLTTGTYNTAVGLYSLLSNSTAKFNTAIGAGTLLSTTADENTAIGAGALLNNAFAGANTASGAFALFSNVTGNGNTAIGRQALLSSISGDSNTAVGAGTLFHNIGGFQSTAVGVNALFNNASGTNNTAIGVSALGNTTGQGNIGVGAFAGNNITTGANNIDIFSTGVSSDNGTIRIGDATQTAAYIGGISGATVDPATGTAVFVDANGKLGTVVSSQRFKDEIRPMDKTSEVILSLQPVSFRYKKELDPHGTPQFGLVAEDVAKVNPNLVVRDKEGKPYSVRYDQVNAMLLNEFLKEHHKVQELEANAVHQQKQIEALTGGLQKVSAQLEVKKRTTQQVSAR